MIVVKTGLQICCVGGTPKNLRMMNIAYKYGRDASIRTTTYKVDKKVEI